MASRLVIQIFIVSLTATVGFSEYMVQRHTMCTGKQDGDQLPNMLECSSYFVCIHGFPQLFRCNDNLYYDSHLKVCNWPENVTCVAISEPQPAPPNFNPQLPPTIPHQQPHKPNGDSPPPYQQIQGKPEYDVPSAPQHPSLPETPVQHPNHQPAPKPQTQNLYEYYAGIAVASNSASQFVCTRDGFYYAPHPSDCQKYFICTNREIHVHQCGFGIHWNYIHSQCDLSDRGMCYARNHWHGGNGGFDGNVPANHEIHSGELVTETENEAIDEIEDSVWNIVEQEMTSGAAEHDAASTVAPENSENNVVETNPPSNDVHQEQTHTEVENEDQDRLEPDCPEYEQAFFPHLKDCNKYFICISGMAILTSCPENMSWNAEKAQCSDEPNLRCHNLNN